MGFVWSDLYVTGRATVACLWTILMSSLICAVMHVPLVTADGDLHIWRVAVVDSQQGVLLQVGVWKVANNSTQ
jgi:hypothetical protein